MQCIQRQLQMRASLLSSCLSKASIDTTSAAASRFSSSCLTKRLSTQSCGHKIVSCLHFQLQPTSHVCGFHTSQRRNVHPAIWVLLKPMFQISAALTGRGVRKWYRKMEPHEKKGFWRRVSERWHLVAGAAGTLAGLFAFYYWSHIQATPITGRKRFVALTHDQILAISQSQADKLIEDFKTKMFNVNSLQSIRVMDVAKKLLKANPELQKMNFKQWEVYVVQDPVVNACVLPSGHVFVFEGMLNMAETQDELAVILGHEMAHALLEHGIEDLSYGQLIDYVVIILMAAIWCVIPFDGIALITHWFHKKLVSILTRLPHSRAVELEADRVGAMLAAKACYDIRQGVVLWKKMEASQKLGTDEPLPTFLSTHPDNEERAEFFDFVIPQAEKWRDEMKCPLWPKKDPRAMIQVLSEIVDNHVAAKKTGQNLSRVKVANSPMARTAADTQGEVLNKIENESTESHPIESENVPITLKEDPEPSIAKS